MRIQAHRGDKSGRHGNTDNGENTGAIIAYLKITLKRLLCALVDNKRGRQWNKKFRKKVCARECGIVEPGNELVQELIERRMVPSATIRLSAPHEHKKPEIIPLYFLNIKKPRT